jgi:protein tyrosine phosphatase (PTP) superfamily phosphohydrolase (DUF442 family)
MSISEAYNFKVVDHLVSTAGLLSEDQLGLLKSEGYEAVINLLPKENKNAVEKEDSIVQEQGLIYEYIPVDFSAPSKENYLEFASKFRALSGKKIILHCAANYRASAFYAIFAHHHLGWSKSEAKEHINSIWCLKDYPVWEIFVDHMLKLNG